MITFRRLECVSAFHSLVYLSLLIVAFVLNGPQPYLLILGWTHGCLWIAMALICLAAVRFRILPFYVAVAVAVLGGIGPFFGTAAFVREDRRRRRASEQAAATQARVQPAGSAIP
jgi:hypothetical protein